MRRFAALYAELDSTRSTRGKREAMVAYFRDAQPEDAAWGLYFLLGNRLKRLIPPTRLRAWVASATGLSQPLVDEAYTHVGDLAETVALMLDTARAGQAETCLPAPLPLHRCVAELQALGGVDEARQREAVIELWRGLGFEPCFLFNKLLTGSLRVGVSSGLASQALADAAGLEARQIAERLMGHWTPSAQAFQALCDPLATPRSASQPYPFCLAQPLEAAPESLGDARDWFAEWKWDGIRGQLIRRAGELFLWSRGEELLNGRFPEVELRAAELPDGTVLDGELLAWRDGRVLPFALLQKRIGRKSPGRKTLSEAPVAFLAYDLLEWQGEDWRQRGLLERRQQLEAVCALAGLETSPRLTAEGWAALATERDGARARGVEGLMLKRCDSAYLAGRKTAGWWKWKVGALTVDTVLIYAQAGHGRRSNLYTDYTLAVWDGDRLVPVAKAYSGLTDAELVEMDRWIRAHTLEKFGPVRSVPAEQVLEIAFEGIQASPRHKSGVALRFPRIARWRHDKRPDQADRIESLRRLAGLGALGDLDSQRHIDPD